MSELSKTIAGMQVLAQKLKQIGADGDERIQRMIADLEDMEVEADVPRATRDTGATDCYDVSNTN